MKIIGCEDCPLQILIGNDMKCFHPETGSNSFTNEIELDGKPYPKWCPLVKESLTIEI